MQSAGVSVESEGVLAVSSSRQVEAANSQEHSQHQHNCSTKKSIEHGKLSADDSQKAGQYGGRDIRHFNVHKLMPNKHEGHAAHCNQRYCSRCSEPRGQKISPKWQTDESIRLVSHYSQPTKTCTVMKEQSQNTCRIKRTRESGESVVHGTAKVTWAKLLDICKEKSIGAYRGRVTKLKEELVNNLDGVHLSTRKVQLDSWRAVALYLQLANRDRLHLPGDYPRYLVRLLTGRRLMRMSCAVVWAFA